MKGGERHKIVTSSSPISSKYAHATGRRVGHEIMHEINLHKTYAKHLRVPVERGGGL